MLILTEIFVPLVILCSMALVGLLLRLDRRLGRGAINAGPRHRENPIPPGLKQTPWELSVIDEQLGRSGSVSQDLVTTVNRLVDAANMTGGPEPLWASSTQNDVERVVNRLEKHLELEPLSPHLRN